jgi:hypothetical protein
MRRPAARTAADNPGSRSSQGSVLGPCPGPSCDLAALAKGDILPVAKRDRLSRGHYEHFEFIEFCSIH